MHTWSVAQMVLPQLGHGIFLVPFADIATSSFVRRGVTDLSARDLQPLYSRRMP